jgi:alcohol dehydrogenase (cytochrome c)
MKNLVVLLVAMTVLFVDITRAQITFERLLKARQEPQNWLTYSGDYAGWRYSTLEQIDTRNVGRLSVQWVYQSRAANKFEVTPLVVDGIMYLSEIGNAAAALDARTGRTLWRYQRELPEKVLHCCGPVNRGLAALGDKLFMATLDAHVIALDGKTGQVMWDVEAADFRKGYGFTLAPLVVKDKVIVGVSGGEFGIRGFIDAYEADTGQRAWRFYTIPGPGEPGHESWSGDSWKTGSAPAWVTGSYDPELNLIYWGVGNPGPDIYGDGRTGDNLYSNCVVALEADTGKLKWHFQFTPHDLHDWDATLIPVLLDLNFRGRPRKLLVQANRNGFYYVLDRTDGQFLLAKQFAHQTWAKAIGPDGRPVVLPGTDPTPEGTYVCPSIDGATNWMSPSYSPQTGLFYVAAREECQTYFSEPQPYEEGRLFWGGTLRNDPDEKDRGALRALDPLTGEMKWEFKHYSAPWAGVLSTAGGLVFSGDMEGYLMAFDAWTGKPLWHFQTGSAVIASPMTYAVDGVQYVVIPAGAALFAFADRGS